MVNDTGSGIWGRSALEVGYPDIIDDSRSLLFVCPFTSIRQWAVTLVELDWTPTSLRCGDVFSLSNPSPSDYVLDTIDDVVATPSDAALENSV